MWKNVNSMKCRGVYEHLEFLEQTGTQPPIGMSMEALLQTTCGQLLDIGQRIAEDDSFWEQVPNVIVSLGEETLKTDLRKWLRDDLASCR